MPDEAAAEGAAARFMDRAAPVVVSDGSDVIWAFQAYTDPNQTLEASIDQAIRSALLKPATAKLDFETLLKSKRSVLKIREAYREVTKLAKPPRSKQLLPRVRRGDRDNSLMNRSTMSLFSGPKPGRSAQKSGWLLTGDACLNDEGVLKNLSKFYDAILPEVGILTAPHHGSKRNLSRAALSKLGSPYFAVVPAAKRKFYGHPNQEVLDALASSGIGVLHAHDDLDVGVVHCLGRPESGGPWVGCVCRL